MTLVFVHGMPETPLVWMPLLEHFHSRDIVTPQLPGFGAPLPNGFTATKDEYANWLIRLLEPLAADGPIDLVGLSRVAFVGDPVVLIHRQRCAAGESLYWMPVRGSNPS